jgi:S1-C subfamily serine protease
MNKYKFTQKWLVFPAAIVILSLALSSCAPVVSVGLPLLQQVQNLAEKANEADEVLSSSSEVIPLADTEPTPPAVPSSSEGTESDEGMASVAAYQGVLMDVYEKVNPSVVNIQVQLDAAAMTGQSPFSLPEDMPFEFPSPETPGEENPDVPMPYASGMGSGFVWDKEGHIITNNHVVEGARQINVLFSNGTLAEAELVGADPDSDLAVIKVNLPESELFPITIADSDTVKVGQLAIAIGNPFGLDGTMTVGIVSALNRTLPAGNGFGPSYSIPNIIQTDAPINPGNSGGVLVDANGNLIGVTTAIESPVRANAGIGFVVPSNIVRRVVPSLIANGKYEHPWLGISAGTLLPQVAELMGLDKSTRGVLVGAVVEGGPADRAGLRGSDQDATLDGQPIQIGGDVIVAIDDVEVKEMEDIINYLSNNGRVGQTITLTILRNGEELKLDVVLGARPSQSERSQQTVEPQAQPQNEQPEDQQQPDAYRPRLGVMGTDLTPAISKALGLNVDKGVLVIEVSSNSPAEEAGLIGGEEEIEVDGQVIKAGGDVIVAIDGTPVSSVNELRRLLNEYVANAWVTLTIIRNGQQQDVKVQLGQ